MPRGAPGRALERVEHRVERPGPSRERLVGRRRHRRPRSAGPGRVWPRRGSVVSLSRVHGSDKPWRATIRAEHDREAPRPPRRRTSARISRSPLERAVDLAQRPSEHRQPRPRRQPASRTPARASALRNAGRFVKEGNVTGTARRDPIVADASVHRHGGAPRCAPRGDRWPSRRATSWKEQGSASPGPDGAERGRGVPGAGGGGGGGKERRRPRAGTPAAEEALRSASRSPRSDRSTLAAQARPRTST